MFYSTLQHLAHVDSSVSALWPFLLIPHTTWLFKRWCFPSTLWGNVLTNVSNVSMYETSDYLNGCLSRKLWTPRVCSCLLHFSRSHLHNCSVLFTWALTLPHYRLNRFIIALRRKLGRSQSWSSKTRKTSAVTLGNIFWVVTADQRFLGGRVQQLRSIKQL